NRPAQRRFQRNRMNRQDQHEPSHAPHALPSPPRTPRMSSSVKTRIKSDIVNEPWTTGREVVINEESNTISLFDVDDTVSHRSRQREVPLRYHGVPIIPHEYSYITSTETPGPFISESKTISLDGLASDQLSQLQMYIPGIIPIHFFLDRQVIITLSSTKSFELAIENIRTPV